MRQPARYALALAAAVFLSCKGPASPTSPLDSFDRAAPDNVERVTAPADGDFSTVQPGYEKTITVSVVRVTNTSGGTVLVGALPPGKPVIVHVDVIDRQTDLAALDQAGGTLGLYIEVNDHRLKAVA